MWILPNFLINRKILTVSMILKKNGIFGAHNSFGQFGDFKGLKKRKKTIKMKKNCEFG